MACEKINPAVIPLLWDFARVVELEAQRLEARDNNECADYGISPIPSGLVIALQTKVRRLNDTGDSIERAQADQGSPLDLLRNEIGLDVNQNIFPGEPPGLSAGVLH